MGGGPKKTNLKAQAGLKKTILAVIGICFAAFLIAFFSIFVPLMLSLFHRMEGNSMEGMKDLMEENLRERFTYLRQITETYANWDDTENFVRSPEPAAEREARGSPPDFIANNWPGTGICAEYGFNIAVFADENNRVVYSETRRTAVGIDESALATLALNQCYKMNERFAAAGNFYHALDETERIHLFYKIANEEIVFVEGQPFMVCTAPVADYVNDAGPSGAFIAGIELDEENFAAMTGNNAESIAVFTGNAAAALSPYRIKRKGFQISITIPVNDNAGNRLMLEAFQNRRNLRSGGKVIIFTSAYLLAASLAVFGIMYALVGRIAAAKEKAEAELERAKDEALFYSEAKSRFISRMSHEMRTPMNGILGMAALVKNAADSGERAGYIEKINDSARDLSVIIDNMLDMVKFEAGTFEPAADEFDLSALVAELADGASRRCAEKGLRFICDKAENLPEFVISDGARIREALSNLLSNAAKFTPKGGSVTFSVGTKIQNDDDAKQNENAAGGKTALRFSVADTGIGISDELAARLWEPFEQGETAITRKYGGVGLGLSIARGIVEALGGAINVASEEGKGTTFAVDIPVALPAKKSAKEINLAEKKILIVDDTDINREILLALLEDTGAVLDAVSGGEEAVQKQSEKKYDIILMDLHMPGMDGYEASRKIRALEAETKAPPAVGKPAVIIAVTADTGGEVEKKCSAAGMDGLVPKPVDIDFLKETIVEKVR